MKLLQLKGEAVHLLLEDLVLLVERSQPCIVRIPLRRCRCRALGAAGALLQRLHLLLQGLDVIKRLLRHKFLCVQLLLAGGELLCEHLNLFCQVGRRAYHLGRWDLWRRHSVALRALLPRGGCLLRRP